MILKLSSFSDYNYTFKQKKERSWTPVGKIKSFAVTFMGNFWARFQEISPLAWHSGTSNDHFYICLSLKNERFLEIV